MAFHNIKYKEPNKYTDFRVKEIFVVEQLEQGFDF
jgi:hypothetical protein